MSLYSPLIRPGTGLLIRNDEKIARLVYITPPGVKTSVAVALTPPVLAALAGQPYVEVLVADDGTVALPSVLTLPVHRIGGGDA